MTQKVAILNITPDSFSNDGYLYQASNTILVRIEELIDLGANIIDIGAQSTRPNAHIISEKEEEGRLFPILQDIISLCHKNDVKVSLDSFNENNIHKGLDIGIDYINHVGYQDNKNIISLLTSYPNSQLIFMHHLTIPSNKEIVMTSINFLQEIYDWLLNRKDYLIQNGIDSSRIIADLGIGFGKTPLQDYEIIYNLEFFQSLDIPLYVGHSKKSFLYYDYQELCKDLKSFKKELTYSELLDKNNAISNVLYQKGVDYIRMHFDRI